jgi:predicted 3-demethylubiquinone-9 3-methyltransferase (glyoxalase superfamily)
MTSITPFLWFDAPVDKVAAWYAAIFPDATITTASDFMASFELAGQKFMALNGGPRFPFTEAVSFFVSCADQKEVDYYWNALTADGGRESMCGWLKDRYGLSWQIIPDALMVYLTHPDRERAARAEQAMLQMRRIVVADLEKAFNG